MCAKLKTVQVVILVLHLAWVHLMSITYSLCYMLFTTHSYSVSNFQGQRSLRVEAYSFFQIPYIHATKKTIKYLSAQDQMNILVLTIIMPDASVVY